MERSMRVLGVSILLSFAVFGCNRTDAAKTASWPEALVVVPKAFNARSTGENDGTVLYDVREPYPANGVIAAIRTKLEILGWRGLQEDFLNPGLPSSLVNGWGNFADARS